MIIPTFGRAAKLGRCIEHLARQDFDQSRFEVLVGIDGGSEAEGAEARDVAARAAGPMRCEVLRLDHVGPGVTRNRLAERARGELLLLLNDDVLPAPDLIARHVEAHRSRAGIGDAMILGAAPWVVHADDTIFELLVRETSMIFFYDRMDAALAAGTTGPDHDWGFRHAWTLNLSLPRAVFARAGGFDPRLKRAMFEDLEFAYRAARSAAQGVPVLYRPDAVVRHDHRMDVRMYLARERALGAAAWELAEAAPECAKAVFGRDVRSEQEIQECRAFVSRERSRAEKILATMKEWEATLASAESGAKAVERMKLLYELHLPLKRLTWREGLLEAAGRSAG